jgi:hypothetical protein
MSSLTKPQLAAENAELRIQLNTQALIHAQELAIIRSKIANAQPSPNLVRSAPVVAAPQWQLDRAARMRAARDEAMTTGRFVKVSA